MQGQDTRRARLAQERQAGYSYGYANPELTRAQATMRYSMQHGSGANDAATAWLNAFVRGRRAAKKNRG